LQHLPACGITKYNIHKVEPMTPKHKVAIIEDDMAIADMYLFKLQQSGYEVRMAFNGKEGIELIKDFRPELLLLDLMMPGMNGDELLEKIRAYEWSVSIRVIILTNISRDEAPSKLRLLKVDRYIVKAHSTPAQIVQIVEEVLNSSSQAA
jgi:DNA-binding response OmpR family regulator